MKIKQYALLIILTSTHTCLPMKTIPLAKKTTHNSATGEEVRRDELSNFKDQVLVAAKRMATFKDKSDGEIIALCTKSAELYATVFSTIRYQQLLTFETNITPLIKVDPKLKDLTTEKALKTIANNKALFYKYMCQTSIKTTTRSGPTLNAQRPNTQTARSTRKKRSVTFKATKSTRRSSVTSSRRKTKQRRKH